MSRRHLLAVTVKLTRKEWIKAIELLGFHEFEIGNKVEGAFTDAVRTQQLECNRQQRINGRFAGKKAASLVRVGSVDL